MLYDKIKGTHSVGGDQSIGLISVKYVETFGYTKDLDPPNLRFAVLSENPRKIYGLKLDILGT